MNTVTRDELKLMIDSGDDLNLVEVLPAKEYESGHLPGAVSLPLENLRQLAPTRLPDRDARILTYCGSSDCPMSTRAAEMLEGMGYTDVSEYVAGKADWRHAGLPLEGAEFDEPSPVRDNDFREEMTGEADAVSSRTIEDMQQMHTPGSAYDA